MHNITEVGMEYDVLRENERLAAENHRMLMDKDVASVDFMGSIGAGKTALIVKLAERLRVRGKKVYGIAGDVTGADDFARMEKGGIKSFNCNTGKDCHLTAHMVHHKLHDMDLDDADVVFIENVGNLVCPADFPLGTDKRVVVVSTTEGDDMVRKHPDIFNRSDFAILNKIDIADAVDVDPDVIVADYRRLTGGRKRMIVTSVRKDIGLDEVLKELGLR